MTIKQNRPISNLLQKKKIAKNKQQKETFEFPFQDNIKQKTRTFFFPVPIPSGKQIYTQKFIIETETRK